MGLAVWVHKQRNELAVRLERSDKRIVIGLLCLGLARILRRDAESGDVDLHDSSQVVEQKCPAEAGRAETRILERNEFRRRGLWVPRDG
jgi:hypothetical protein